MLNEKHIVAKGHIDSFGVDVKAGSLRIEDKVLQFLQIHAYSNSFSGIIAPIFWELI